MEHLDQHRQGQHTERGFAMLALVTLLVPLLLLVGTFLQTMSGRQGRLQTEVKEEQALLTAEAGVDFALNEARRGTLVAGHMAEYEFSGTLDRRSNYETVCTYLGDDDSDNDGDAAIDEEDEDVFRVTSTGSFGTSQRRIATYLGFVRYLPAISGAMTFTNPASTIEISGTPYISGTNTNLNGTAAGGDVFGMTMAPPGTLANLTGELSPSEGAHVVGATTSPSAGVSAPIDVPAIVDFARNSASIVITNSNVSGIDYGTLAAPVVAYREGDVRIQGNSSGHGLLVVNGDLNLAGTFRWNGIVVCTGQLTAGAGTAQIYGAVIMGPSSPGARMVGTLDIRYSTEGINLAERVLGRYAAFNGWQEISTNS